MVSPVGGVGFRPVELANPKGVVRERNYILKAYRRRLLKYNEVASRKLPLGSGAVESLIRQVVNLRMKGNSKFFRVDSQTEKESFNR
jgi:hypothetical protein